MDEYYDMLRKYVKTSLVVVYGQSWCPHCRAARKTLGKRGVYVEMASFESGISKSHQRILKDLLETDGGIPIIFVGQKRIQNQDLEKHLGVSRKRSMQDEDSQHNKHKRQTRSDNTNLKHLKQEDEKEEEEEEEEEEAEQEHVKQEKNDNKKAKGFHKPPKLPSLADQLRAAAKSNK